jgi:hypothetical protein
MRSEVLAIVVSLSVALVFLGSILIAVIRMPPASEITLDISAKEGKALFHIRSQK